MNCHVLHWCYQLTTHPMTELRKLNETEDAALTVRERDRLNDIIQAVRELQEAKESTEAELTRLRFEMGLS